MNRKTAILALFFCMLLPCAAAIAEVKIAVVDLEDVFNRYYKTKIAAANLKKQADVFKAYAEKLNESRNKLQEEFKQLRDDSQNLAMSKAEQENKRIQAQDKYRQVKEKEAELTQYNQAKVEQLKQERAQMRDRLLGEIREELAKRAALAGYTVIFDKSGKSLSNIPVIIYHAPGVDLTETIVKELNRGHETDKKSK